jgi:hypothetical protein
MTTKIKLRIRITSSMVGYLDIRSGSLVILPESANRSLIEGTDTGRGPQSLTAIMLDYRWPPMTRAPFGLGRLTSVDLKAEQIRMLESGQ